MGSICMYTPAADGGHPLYTWELMTALSRHASDDTRFELVTAENLAEEFHTDAYPIHAVLPRLRLPSEFASRRQWAWDRLRYYPRREGAFLQWLKGRPDITAVHFQEYKPWLIGKMVRHLHASGRRVYYTVHNIHPHDYPRGIPKWLWDKWNHDFWRACDGLFVLTPKLAEQLAQVLGKNHPPIHVVPHGIWTVRQPVSIPPLEERLKWKRLLFFGTIRRNKGLELLLQAAESLQGFSITIAGEPMDSAYFDTVVMAQVRHLRELGVPVDVMKGFTPEAQVPALLARHSALILPYTQQFAAQSGVVFLALAHGLPVVASEVGGLRDLFHEFEIGTTFSDLTPGGLAAAVRKLFDAVSSQHLAGEIEAAREHCSWDAAAIATMAGYGLTPTSARSRDLQGAAR